MTTAIRQVQGLSSIIAGAGSVAALGAFIMCVPLAAAEDLAILGYLLPIPVLALAAAVGVTRRSAWTWLFLLGELAFIILAIASVGLLYAPGLLLGLLGALVGLVAPRWSEPS